MKIALAQQNYCIGDFSGNTAKIKEAIREATLQQVDLLVFSELCICGYPPRDFLDFNDFMLQSEKAVMEIAKETDGMGVLLGAPSRNPTPAGKDLYNSAFFLAEGAIQAVVHKTLLPNYDVFDEYRYFEPATSWQVVPFRGKKLAITICEDIWDLSDNPLYTRCPLDELMYQQPDIIINLSASPFDYTHREDRKAILKANARKYKRPIFYCNTVGSQTEIIFDGGSMVMDADANLIAEAPYFEEALLVTTLTDENKFTQSLLQAADTIPHEELNPLQFDPDLHTDRLYKALVLGIRDYFAKMGFKQAIIGSSGGIDSAVTLVLAADALGADAVHALLMPSGYSSTHSVADAELLAANLGHHYHIVPIQPIFETFLHQLQPIFQNRPSDLAEENIQARVRGNLLMAVANKLGYILLNTTNKSECATGYGTLYGDMAGGLSVLGDVYKTQVYALARYINRKQERIPINILQKPPSAELRPGQKDSDSLPEYALLDALLYQYIERCQGPADLQAAGYDEELVERVLKLVNQSEYKRNQFCPILRVSPRAFGVGRRMPIVGRYLNSR